MTANYKEILRGELLRGARVLQYKLIDMDNYSEEVYQLLKKVIDELDRQAEEEENEF